MSEGETDIEWDLVAHELDTYVDRYHELGIEDVTVRVNELRFYPFDVDDYARFIVEVSPRYFFTSGTPPEADRKKMRALLSRIDESPYNAAVRSDIFYREQHTQTLTDEEAVAAAETASYERAEELAEHLSIAFNVTGPHDLEPPF